MTTQVECKCRCHAYGPGSLIECNVDDGSSGVPGKKSCGYHENTAGSSLVARCIFPRCDGDRGQPVITDLTICDPCRRRYRRLLDWLVLDFVTLKTTMQSPVRRGEQTRITANKSFGHPAQWASDTVREIADVLYWADDGLREHLKHEPPPHPFRPDTRVVAHAYASLTARFNSLCEYPAAEDTAIELSDLHGKIRSSLGLTQWRQRLPAPCPQCGVAAMIRTTHMVHCECCGETVLPEQYEFFTRVILDDLIAAYDTRKVAELA